MPAYAPDPQTTAAIFKQARPLYQAADRKTGNLGFGHLYYSFTRVLRPKHVLVIGSGHGFSPVVFARALYDNRGGRLTFVDPSFSFGRNTWLPTNRGAWDNPNAARQRFAKFDVQRIATHYKELDTEFFPRYHQHGLPPVNLALIDGNHAYKYARYDFEQTVRLMPRGGYIFLHDARHPLGRLGSGVPQLIDELRAAGWNIVTLPGGAGLGIVEVTTRAQ